MKKIIYCLLAVVMLSACGNDANKKQVGDFIEVNGVKGIVFEVSDDGQHGKVMSISQTECDWYDAKTWCATLGQGWKLPTKDELLVIYSKKSVVNSVLSANGYQLVHENACYWSSDKETDGYMWIVSMENGETDGEGKNNFDYVRAVASF